jgi:hypothetical protein
MNNTMFISRSLIFYPGFFEDNCQELSDQIIVPSYYLNRLMDHFEDGEKLYLNMTNTNTNKNILVAIGSPHSFDRNTIFAPQWILDLIDCTGCCESVITLTKADMSEVPVATKIIIKPLDPIAFELDTLACFEKAFMNLHSIKEGITLNVPVPQLGKGYTMLAYIEKVEPAAISQIVEGDVDVEFINEFKEVTPTTPIITPTAPLESSSDPMIPNTTNPIVTPSSPVNEVRVEVSAEERRKIVRDSWIKRYQNNAGSL